MQDLLAELKVKVVERLRLSHVTPDQIQDDAPLFGDGLGLDSIDAVELVVMLEKSYGIRLTEMETAKRAFATIASLARFIAERRARPRDES
jgi:acyl carrier protein